MVEIFPWDRHPDLTRERLSTIATELVRVRDDALLAHEPHKGDKAWGFGCRALERQMYAIITLAAREKWLTILEDGRHFVFLIGQVPVRFYKGRADKPKPNTLRQNLPELAAQQGAFTFAQDQKWCWRLAIETDVTGRVARVVVVEASFGDKRNRAKIIDTRTVWEIPLMATVGAIADLAAPKREGKQLAKPSVRPKVKTRTTKDGTNDGGE